MTKQSLFLGLAAWLLASLGFAAPSQAGFITNVSLTNNTGIAVDDLEVTWTGAGGSISGVVLNTPPGTFSVVNAGNSIDFTFSSNLASGGTVDFSFDTTTSPLTFGGGNWSFTTSTGVTFRAPIDSTRDKLTFSTSPVVPEPTSMYLLGIGMAGFLAFRPFSKRAAL